MKYIIWCLMILTIAACGKGGGGGSSSSSENTSEIRSKCNVKIDRTDLITVAVSSSRIRTECKLDEEGVMQLIGTRHP